MSIQNYSVLRGRAADVRQGSGKSPHFQILVIDQTNKYRIAINIQSSDNSEVFYVAKPGFRHPICDALLEQPIGLTAVASSPGGVALDFIRGNLFQPSEMVQLPISAPGPDNDLNEKLNAFAQRAMSDEQAEIFALGQAWGPEPYKQDQYFHFLPGRGIHDIHMNQGNPPHSHDQDNGVWQDGGLFFRFPGDTREADQWCAVFMKFASQSWHTDDMTGNVAVGEGGGASADGANSGVIDFNHQPTVDQPDGQVHIVAALVNDVHTPEHETVTLLNTTHEAVDLAGWLLKDKQKHAMTLHGVIDPGESLRVDVVAPMALSNKGGLISLINARGLKVHGVAYTKEAAAQPGRTLTF
ncbi:DUF2278 family protein [Rhizobium sp. VS19-DR104.2]|uniref:DUF2278 family protein n=1 Tax=unclassified Rhizobium TaxID=2613769 RepID=UPI001AD9AA9A|nr:MULTISPECIES: DUF2278 family protein [unclassified Rhizobium]MBO9101223.1 DUF2278 family protein [Rhizobium sp. L58/93]MBO9170876.1 DUF2278 family protein [Rhizobium sp. L245/93]MBO9186789.1 DUF2278 family protein [Rhizobium sp. E27B/91]MBZ5763140.1 DUF2278 family protein [Rhizobium sp. VS19-DR96]MBZ5769056.1 DUF2278 family protein [Rhizobium sp. VS19-DR129.2]